ncbi:CDK2-associated and cullin domain-containing protein 1 [Aplysia californica]|uniref:CDK2-associated and cullin domain-containing protein 1 n=1 Tax=Aplysia californica TaxID=6500 RepID=A0ABM0JAX2_APLCA|nr:CDK2-associated and cullin domain-containing protein 1 [Aplysia californica]
MDEPMESSAESPTADLPGDLLLSSTVASGVEVTNSRPSELSQSELIETHSAVHRTENSAGDADDKSKPQPCFSPLLRPGSMVMMTLTEKDYEEYYWPELKTAINQLLNMKPGAYIPISYEQMYSCVYKCVCKQFSERLYNDLLRYLSEHMEYLNAELKSHETESIPFIETFSFLMHQYIQALTGIVPIFNYLNRFYVENKLKTDLNEELRKLFRTKVVDIHIHTLIKLLDEVSCVPFAISPPTMASIMKNLYALNEDYSKLNPGLFSRYLPNILPPTDPTLLEQYAQEARKVQEHIAGMHNFKSHDSSRKRVYEDDISVN